VLYIFRRVIIWQGKKSLEEAIRLKPSYADSYYNLACLYALMGKEILGLEYLKKAASLHGSVIEWAKKDKDLEKVRKLSGFKEIIKDGQLVTPVGIFENKRLFIGLQCNVVIDTK